MTNDQGPARAAPATPPAARRQEPLEHAPPGPPAPAAPPKPATVVDIVAHVRSPEGMDMDITVRNVVWEGTPAGLAPRALAIEKALLTAGFKAVPAPVVAAPAAAGGGAATNAVLSVNEDGTRTCSVHGPARYVPAGTNQQGKQYPGRWYCTNRDCKARE